MRMLKINARYLKNREVKLSNESIKNAILRKFDHQTNGFDGQALKELLFPKIESSSIFISHSHDDLGKAYFLKQYIEEQSSKQVFIDSCYWNSVDVAKKILEKKYDLDSVSKHLHIMLITALSKMIEACDLFLFIDGPNSLSKNTKTRSPWIYYELQIAEMFKEIESRKASGTKIVTEALDHRPPMPCFYDVEEIIKNMDLIHLEDL